jgi:hypothetical protein
VASDPETGHHSILLPVLSWWLSNASLVLLLLCYAIAYTSA